MLNIPFDPKWQNVAIAVSGGADSALLAYLVCQKAKEQDHVVTIHLITNVRGWKTKPWQKYDADAVYNWLFQRFYHTKFVRHINFVPPEFEWADKGPTIVDEYGKLVSGDNIELRAYGEYVCFHNKVDAYFNGVTRNPKDVEFKGMPTRDIELTEDNKHLLEMEHMGFMVYHPFRFTDKSEIVKMYKSLDIMDLFELTRSCEGDDSTRPEVFMGLDYKTYQPGQSVPICGRCFWCKERAWAWENAK
jgi:7-cyano-7-deazaguanine synthase in queuosine biosynthesis